jgi:hypothetical protein
MDSIGSKRAWSEVEPAEWKMLLVGIGVGMLFVGVIILLGG